MSKEKQKFGFNATWSMAVGGMVGGGIFSVLGVIVKNSGNWAWLSFAIAGAIALVSAISYSHLSVKYKQSGGAFTFLNEMNMKGISASLAWILLLGYILTLSVYAFTFGHYVAHVFDWGSWLPRTLSLIVIAVFTGINLQGVGNSAKTEIITVWGKLLVLLALAVFGITQWDPGQLTAGIGEKNWSTAITGAATIFMAYEGFQLLSYDYKDIRKANKNLPKAMIWAVVSVTIVYILVALGATMLVGAKTLVNKEEVALAIAGQQIMGFAGLIIVTIAAAFSTGSAINATMFSTARLMESVAYKNDLPAVLSKENDKNIPYMAVISLSVMAAVLSVIGSLGMLVDAASLIFLLTFGIVNFIAFYEKVKFRFLSLAGGIACMAAIVVSSIEQMQKNPWPLFIMMLLFITAFVARPFILKIIRRGSD